MSSFLFGEDWSAVQVVVALVKTGACDCRCRLEWVIDCRPTLGTYMARDETVVRSWRMQTLGL